VGLPVLTCAGDTYVSRMAGSLLNAAHLPELVTKSLADYEKLAVRLSTKPELLADLRQRLVASRDRLPLFDMARFTRNLETAYRTMQDIRAAGEPPRFFAVDPAPHLRAAGAAAENSSNRSQSAGRKDAKRRR
jgi:protein O-GlcNAc transferase